MIRLFVALEIPDHIKDHLFELRRSVCSDELNFRWEPKEKIHITLKFIGDVEDNIVNDISRNLLFLESFNKINCEINKFGFFFRQRIPTILWASLKLDPTAYEMVKKINDELMKLGIEKENRKFKPHLTLLRIKKHPGTEFVDSFNKFYFEPMKFESERITLFKSELQKAGSRYFEIKNYNLN